jgi:hypothetical protein
MNKVAEQTQEKYAHQTDEELVKDWGTVDNALRILTEQQGRIEMELTNRMQSNGATVIPHTTHDVKLVEGAPGWDYPTLAQLREITDPTDLDGAYTSEHEETRLVPERWNMVKGKALARFGDKHRQIIQAARLPGVLRLRIKTK